MSDDELEADLEDPTSGLTDADFAAMSDSRPATRMANLVLLQVPQEARALVRLRSGGGPVETRVDGGAWETLLEPDEALAEPLARRLAEMVNVTDLWPGPCQGFLTLVLGADRREGFDVFLRPRRSGDVRVVVHRAALRPEVQAAVGAKSEAVLQASVKYFQQPSEKADAAVRQAMERSEKDGAAGVAPLLDGIWARLQHLTQAGRWTEAAEALARVEAAVESYWGCGPELTQLQAARGQILIEAGQLEEAGASFERALEGARERCSFHPMAADLLDSLAEIAQLQGRTDEASRRRDEAASLLAELDPEDAGIDALKGR